MYQQQIHNESFETVAFNLEPFGEIDNVKAKETSQRNSNS